MIDRTPRGDFTEKSFSLFQYKYSDEIEHSQVRRPPLFRCAHHRYCDTGCSIIAIQGVA